MPEQELNSTASKFISSLIKSLQIICNGHVDFNESIELIGHINVRIDSKFKYDYIVNEHVSKEGEDCSTTFLSNSYHSHPPPRATCIQNDHTQPEQDLSLSTLPAGSYKSQQSQSSRLGLPVNDGKKTEEASHRYNVNVDTQKAQDFQENQMVFKLEEDESNECMMLPTSADNYEPLDDVDDARMKSSSSIGPECAEDSLGVARTRKRQKLSGQAALEVSETQVDVASNLGLWHKPSTSLQETLSKSHLGMNKSLTDKSDIAGSKVQSKNINSFRQSPAFKVNQQTRSLVCKFCNNVWDSLDDYKEHMCNIHKYVSCQLCSILCPTNGALRGHMNREHTPKLVCPICSKTFHCKVNYSGHMNMHYGTKPYSCRTCGKLFAYQQSKHAHEKICCLPTPS